MKQSIIISLIGLAFSFIGSLFLVFAVKIIPLTNYSTQEGLSVSIYFADLPATIS
ncbi:MAG: hypothetical protein Q7S74_05215 [Nanoarchaeota archaeon]|nr:hypothetical protein [Nanoarchaeota archaeon]